MAIMEQEQREDRDRSKQTNPSLIGDGYGPALLRGQTPATFFAALEQSGELPDGVSAKAAAAAVLLTLGLRLSQPIVQTLCDSLPPECSCLLAFDPDLCSERAEALGRPELTQRVARHLELTEDGAEALTRAVLLSLRAHLPSQTAEAVDRHLSLDLVHLWHAPARHEAV